MFSLSRAGKGMLKPSARSFQARSFSMNVFNTEMKNAQRNNAALQPDTRDFDYIKEEITTRVIDRLAFINMDFPKVLELGCGNGSFGARVAQRFAQNVDKPYRYVKPEVSMDTVSKLETDNSLSNLPPSDQAVSQDELARAMDSIERYSIPGLQSYTVVDPSEARVANALAAAEVELEAVPADKQYALNAVVGDLDKADYGEGYDLIVSNLALHWENDLPTVFNKAMAALKPNGAFIGAVIGGESLRELRSSFTVAGLERRGGVTQHVSPLTRPRDIGDLLGAAGFQMLTVDMDALTVQYPDMFTLCDHLQRMGEQNAPAVSSAVPRDIFLAAQAAYEALYKDPESGLLVCSVDVVMFIGWKYHDSMHKASSRGTANAKLGDIIEEANNDK